jgi:hypothetical protein
LTVKYRIDKADHVPTEWVGHEAPRNEILIVTCYPNGPVFEGTPAVIVGDTVSFLRSGVHSHRLEICRFRSLEPGESVTFWAEPGDRA